MKKTLLIITSSLFLTACSDEMEGKDIEPESMADCIAIENPNNRDICKMKMQVKLDALEKERNKNKAERILGSKEATSVRF